MFKMYRSIKAVFPYLPLGARRFLWVYVIASTLLSFLDIAAFALLSLTLGALANGTDFNIPLVGTYGQDAAVPLLFTVGGLLIAKGLLNTLLYFIVTRRMADYEQEMGDTLFRAYMSAPWAQRVGRNSAELVRLVDLGVGNTIGGIIVPGLTLPAEIATLTAIVVVLFLSQPITALVTVIYLGIVAALMVLLISRPAKVAGRVNRDASFRIVVAMTEMLAALKEITLRGKLNDVAGIVQVSRRQATRARGNTNFLSRVPQFIVEMALVGGFALIGGVGFLTGDATTALTSVALFGVAGFRLMPSLVRLQSVVTSAQSPMSYLEVVLEDLEQFGKPNAAIDADAAADLDKSAEVDAEKPLLNAELNAEDINYLRLNDVTFAYPGAAKPALSNASVEIKMGSRIGVAGASGAGKSTFIDLVLGLLEPSSGEILIDDHPLHEVVAAWRSRVGYVPQDVQLFDGSVAQNVALTWGDDYDLERVEAALQQVGMLEVIKSRPGGLEAPIGERGLSLSGGQRQRLGIARALYADPLVLVLDEATSALDTATEEDIQKSIEALHGKVTVISVAHRLSTIRSADRILFMDAGRIATSGTFEEVVAGNETFARQARLSGLA